MLHDNAVKYLSSQRVECLNLLSLLCISRVALLFVCSSRILFFAMDASLAPVARSGIFPAILAPKKSNTLVSVFSRGTDDRGTSCIQYYVRLSADE